jgi:hypothetical protein
MDFAVDSPHAAIAAVGGALVAGMIIAWGVTRCLAARRARPGGTSAARAARTVSRRSLERFGIHRS